MSSTNVNIVSIIYSIHAMKMISNLDPRVKMFYCLFAIMSYTGVLLFVHIDKAKIQKYKNTET